MRRRLIIGLVVLAILAAAGFGGVYWYVAHPPDRESELPEQMVSLDSARGSRLLETSSHRADLEPIRRHFHPQIYRSYCGVATAATILRAESEDSAQTTFFDRDDASISGWDVFFSGLTLDELAEVFRTRGYAVEVDHAGDASVEDFRRALESNLESPGDFLVVNYSRSAAGATGGGHISPVAAYHEPSDRVLVWETARYKYPPHWLSAERLFEAMATVDDASGETRGYLQVESDD